MAGARSIPPGRSCRHRRTVLCCPSRLTAGLSLSSGLDVRRPPLWQFGRYLVSMYRQPLRFVLTYVLPVAFISTVPALALTRGASLILIVVGLTVGGGAIALVALVWQAGLKRYTSATS